MRTLKRGFALTLAEYPSFAGRIRVRDVSRGTTHLDIGSGDPGVSLNYRDLRLTSEKTPAPDEIPDCLKSFQELERSHFPLHLVTTDLLSPLQNAQGLHDFNNAPLLRTQVTFIPGGMILTICASHHACDRETRKILLRSWSENCSNVDTRGDAVAPSHAAEQPLVILQHY